MKLRELAIEGLGTQKSINIGRFGDGLSMIYGENSFGKSRLCQFIRNTFLGHRTVDSSSALGNLTVAQGINETRLSRDPHSQLLNSTTLGSEFSSNPIDERQILGGLSSELYETVFNFSLKETPNNSLRLASTLKTQLNIPLGPQAAGDDSAVRAWERESNELRNRLESLKLQMASLTGEKANIVGQIESTRLSAQSRMADLEREISLVLPRLNELQANNLNEQLAAIEHEIAQLRLVIENAKTRVAHIPPAPPIDEHAALYQRLDEIDNQIRRWRHVQTDIQSQRVRLRDEMIVWNELTLDSDDHPYHNAREILVALESKVDQAERQAKHWSGAAGERVDASQLAESLRAICKNMRDDVYGLCNELSQQYKHIRHKAAAAELKQLRRCYNEMGESINRLVERRNESLKEIARIDPAGADAIVRADIKFCQCAQHQGHLEARRRFVGAVAKSAPIQPTYEVRTPNLDAEHAQLRDLEQRRADLLNHIGRIEVEMRDLGLRHTELLREKSAFSASVSSEFDLRLQRIDIELQELAREQNTLLQRLDSPFVSTPPNPLLLRAGEILTRLSSGDLTQVFLDQTGATTEVNLRDRFGKVLNFSAVEQGLQDQAYLALVLAAKELLIERNVELPTIIDDAFCRIGSERVSATLSLLNEFGQRGHQVIATTQHRYLADRLPGVPLFELAPRQSSATTTNYSAPPINQAPINRPPIVSNPPTTHVGNAWETSSVETTDTYYTSDQPRAYPLTKYPRSNPNYGQEDRGYTITYPFAQGSAKSEQFEQELYGSPISAGGSRLVTSVKANQVAAPASFGPAIDDNTLLEKVACFDASQLRAFDEYRLVTVGDLLMLEPNQAIQFGIRADQLDQWQSLVWLLSNVPGMRITDAQILVACGVTEPEQLDTSHAKQLYERVQRFLSSSEGRRFAGHSEGISHDRISGWHRAINGTRARWSNRSRRSRTSFSRSERAPRQQQDHDTYDYDRRERQPREPREARSYTERTPREARAPRMNPMSASAAPRSDREERVRPERQVAPSAAPVARLSATEKPRATRVTRSKSNTSSSEKLKFYLDLSDHIEAAPSIGPKTAERFEKIGVVTVADFLRQTAESMATKINYKRITAEIVRLWQQQARLICRVPNLRGHDAQLLVSCGITEPEELSTMQPANLMDIIGPFSETKEGLKIIRNGKKPDLEEITDWISWAEHTRSIQAA